MSLLRRFMRPASGLATALHRATLSRASRQIMGILLFGYVISLYRLLIFGLSFNSNCSSRKALTAKNFRLEMNTEAPEFAVSVLTQCDNYLEKRINFGLVGQSGCTEKLVEIRFERFRLISAGNLTKKSRPGNAFQHESWIAFNKHK